MNDNRDDKLAKGRPTEPEPESTEPESTDGEDTEVEDAEDTEDTENTDGEDTDVQEHEADVSATTEPKKGAANTEPEVQEPKQGAANTEPEVQEPKQGAANTEPDTDPSDAGQPAGAGPGWERIRNGFRPSRGQAIIGAVLGLVAFLAVVQVRVNLADDGYANARREDLIAILDGLGQSTRRLEAEIAELQQRKTSLSTGADRAETARAQAQEQVKVLGILAGTLPAKGPGVRITLNDPDGKVTSNNLLDAVQELRDAGAEAIQINGTVRVVASTELVDDPPGLKIDEKTVRAPYVIEAIGDSHNLSEAANFPGGLVSEIEGPQVNGTAVVTELATVQITALHTPDEHRYARPAASPTK